MAEDRSSTTSTRERSRAALNETLVHVAERELGGAVVAQVRPPMGMYVSSSSAERAVMHRAVRAICSEAHRLDVRAEEMLVDIKQAWAQLAPLRAPHLGDRDGDVLREVVSTAIEVFFEARDVQNARGAPLIRAPGAGARGSSADSHSIRNG